MSGQGQQRNWRDRDQPALDEIRQAIAARSETTVTLRNYRRNGELFCNRFTLQPLTDRNGQLIYFLDVQYDVTTEIEAQEEVERLRRLLEDQEAADKDSQDPR